jgi:peptide/nickel transport system substrate-binding protein
MLGGSAAAFSLVACGQTSPEVQQTSSSPASERAEDPATSAAQSLRGGTLRVAFPGVISTLDPTLIYAIEDGFVSLALYETLVWLNEKMEVQPALATDWQESEDRLSWTFTLREGITFHDGTPFAAEDVVSTFERILDPQVGSPSLSMLNFITAVEAEDTHRVRFDLERPSVIFASLLSFLGTSIIQRGRSEDDLANEPIGTGPFTFAELLPGERLRMVRNENYWKPDRPYLDEVQYVYLPEATTRMEALNSGVVDIIWNLDIEQIPIANAGLHVLQGADISSQYIILNMRHAPMDDGRVRKALKLCVDRAGMLQVATKGRGSLANDQPVFPWHPMHADIPPREQDIEQAKTLLAEAGYADGLTLTMATSTPRPGMLEISVAFQEMAQQAGITIELDKMPVETYWSDYLNYPLSVSNFLGTPPILDVHLSLLYHSAGAWHEPGYENAELDSLIEQVVAEQDEQQRAEMYARIQQIISEEGAWIIPYYRPTFVASRKTVQDLDVLVDSFFSLTDVWLEQEG